MIQASMLISRQVTTPVEAVSPRLRSWVTTGSRGGVGPINAKDFQLRVGDELKIGCAATDG